MSFSLDRKKRPGGEYVRCSVCSSERPKFLSGAVVWSPDWNLRLIGHECAARNDHFGEAVYRNMRRQREQEELDTFALDWLQTYIADLKETVPALQAVRLCAIHLEEQQGVFFKRAKQLATMLASRARHHGGVLVVSEQLSEARRVNSASGALQSLYEDIAIGTMRGFNFLIRPKKSRSRQLEGNLAALAMIPDGQGEEPVLALMDQGEKQITVVAGTVFRAVQLACDLADECADAALFVSEENLAVLRRWGGDGRNRMRFKVRKYSTGIEFALSDRDKIVIKANWPNLPDLGPLRRIVAAGIRLEKLRA